MPIAFHAEFVQATNEGWGTLVVLSADETLEAERYLIVQRATEYSEQDKRLGMDDVYIETCGQGWSWYGHIESFRLCPKKITVQLDGEAAARIGDTGAIEASFSLSPEEFANLREALRQAFSGCPYYSEAAA
jgi:hypothetical protein